MKKLIDLFVLLTLGLMLPTFSGCSDDKKDEPTKDDGNTAISSIIGTWVPIEAFDPHYPAYADPLQECYILVFKEDQTYLGIDRYDGTVLENSHYTFDGTYLKYDGENGQNDDTCLVEFMENGKYMIIYYLEDYEKTGGWIKYEKSIDGNINPPISDPSDDLITESDIVGQWVLVWGEEANFEYLEIRSDYTGAFYFDDADSHRFVWTLANNVMNISYIESGQIYATDVAYLEWDGDGVIVRSTYTEGEYSSSSVMKIRRIS